MSRKHGAFITYVRNGVEINALVAFSRDVYTPATQAEPAKSEEHLTVVYLDPAADSTGAPTGDQLRNSIRTQFDVLPLVEGAVNGWKEIEAESDHPVPERDDQIADPTAEGIVTSSGNTQEQLDTEHDEQHAGEAADAMTDAEKDKLAEAASAPVPTE